MINEYYLITNVYFLITFVHMVFIESGEVGHDGWDGQCDEEDT